MSGWGGPVKCREHTAPRPPPPEERRVEAVPPQPGIPVEESLGKGQRRVSRPGHGSVSPSQTGDRQAPGARTPSDRGRGLLTEEDWRLGRACPAGVPWGRADGDVGGGRSGMQDPSRGLALSLARRVTSSDS